MSPAVPTSAEPTSRAARLSGRLRGALPTLASAILGSLGWAVAMGVVAATKLAWMRWFEPDRIAFITLFFVLGAFLAFFPAIYLGRLFSRGRRDAGFAATFLALALATVGLTAFLFGLQYRLYYAGWHETPLSVVWVFQFLFTVGAAVYQFLVLGARLYLPFGLIALAAVSFWNVRGMR